MSLENSVSKKSGSDFHLLVNPFWITGFIVLIALLGVLGLPEKAAALIILVAVIGISAANPINGIVAIIILAPFFLEAGNRPYFFMLEIFVLATLLSAAIRYLKKNGKATIPIKRILLLFILVSVAAFPLDAREFYYELWARSYRELFDIWMVGHLGSKTYYLRSIYNLLTGVGLFLVVACFWDNKRLDYSKRLVKAYLLTAVLVSLAGVFLYYQIVPAGKSYLSASLVGLQGGMTAFAYNKAFLVQYLSFALCFGVVMARMSGGSLRKSTPYYFSLILFLFVMFMSRQRIAIVIILIPLLLYGALLLFQRHKRSKAIFLAVIMGAVMIGVIAMDHFILGGGFSEKFGEIYEDERIDLWRAAIYMFLDNPVLGVGTGRYHYFFPEYYDITRFVAEKPLPPSINSHSFYFQILAEKGAIGVLATMALIGAVIIIAWRKYTLGSEDIKSPLFLSSLACLFIWLIHGGVNHIGHIRSFDLFFWILLGFIVVNGKNEKRPFDISRNAAIYAVGIIMIASVFQVWSLANRPLRDNYSIGFFHSERLPLGGIARWTRKRAVEFLTVDNEKLIYRISAPLPGAKDRPQQVTIRVKGVEKRLTVNDRRWRNVVFDVGESRGQSIAVMIETSYTFNPAKEAGGRDNRDLGVYVQRIIMANDS